jgi:hypothetical protein
VFQVEGGGIDAEPGRDRFARGPDRCVEVGGDLPEPRQFHDMDRGAR